jgi:hypothetical protein
LEIFDRSALHGVSPDVQMVASRNCIAGNIRRRYLQELPRRSFGDRRVNRLVISGLSAQIIGPDARLITKDIATARASAD